MNRTVCSLLFLAAAAGALAQQIRPDSEAAEERKARLREMVAQESGQITALEPSTMGAGAVFVGYSSGTVLRCRPSQAGCEEFSGTPNIPVEGIAASRQGESEIVWLSYAQGALYRCLETQCTKLVHHERR